jgi:BirA family transcriptional regulator, biotin operon repressor / biotin---[acetyl-CoA-carboxylase] ligase
LARAILAGNPPPDGQWWVADRQISGRGRLGREWFDGIGNFMGSTVVKLREGDPPPHSLALVAACTVQQALAQFLPLWNKPIIKWPNDILIGDAKLAGILLERTDGHIVVGIGVNLVSAPQLPNRRTIALAPLGISVSRDVFAEALSHLWPDYIEKWRRSGLGTIILEWLSLAHPLGTVLTVNEGSQAGLTGKFDGLELDGALRLRVADGALVIVHAGDVSLRK